MCTRRDRGADFREVLRHRPGIAPGHDQAGAFGLGWTDRAEDIGGFGALIVRRPRACTDPRPSSGVLVLLSDPGLILKPDFYFGIGREAGADRR